MGRNRSFTTEAVLDRTIDVFGSRGYEGTSVDDLVRELGLHRGSLYGAFGSKRGLLLAALERLRTAPSETCAQDLVLVALAEVAPHDPEVRASLIPLIERHFAGRVDDIGLRLLDRAGLIRKEEA